MAPETRLPWTGAAFGLAIESDFELPGLRRAPAAAAARAIALELREPAEWPAEEPVGQRISEWRDPEGALVVGIDHHADGYRFLARGAGLYELAADATRAVCTPVPDAGWLWRRYLVGQVLPFAALLRGLEVFHASAVEVDGAAVALVGPSGVGKSTLALNLHLAGAGFVTDDVLAIERSSGLIAHPGVAAAKVRTAAETLVSADRERLGALVSADEHEQRYQVESVGRPLPLRTFCLLELGDAELEVQPAIGDPWSLLASTFNLVIEDPARLQSQLDLCSAIARDARMLRVRVPARPGPEAARALIEQLGSAIAA